MRKPQEITIDRTLLIYGLHLAREWSMVSDVKVQQLIFLAELQMFGKGVRGLHYEFMRFPYGAFSKDLDNDLLALRKKERLQNFDVVGEAEACISLLEAEDSFRRGRQRTDHGNPSIGRANLWGLKTWGRSRNPWRTLKSAWSIDPKKNYTFGTFRFIPSCLFPPVSK